MSRQTSLQRTERESAECHHPLIIVEIGNEPEAESSENEPCKKPLNSGKATPMPKINQKKNLSLKRVLSHHLGSIADF